MLINPGAQIKLVISRRRNLKYHKNFVQIFWEIWGGGGKMTVVKWSTLVNLTIDHEQNRGCHGHGQLF